MRQRIVEKRLLVSVPESSSKRGRASGDDTLLVARGVLARGVGYQVEVASFEEDGFLGGIGGLEARGEGCGLTAPSGGLSGVAQYTG